MRSSLFLSTAGWAAAIALSSATAGSARAAAGSPAVCLAKKFAGAANAAAVAIGCGAGAARSGGSMSGCSAKATSVVARTFAAANRRGTCGGDQTSVAGAIASAAADAVAAVPGGPAKPARRCASRKLHAAAGAARNMFRCAASTAKRGGTPSTGCSSPATSALTAAFARADAKGGCATTGNASAIAERLGRLLADVVSAVGSGGGTPAPGVHFAADVQPIFTASCALAGCHAGATPQGGLDLASGHAYASIVGVPASEAPGMQLVQPGAPDKSYLFLKITGAPSISGAAMPLGAPLPSSTIDVLRTWITQGAAND